MNTEQAIKELEKCLGRIKEEFKNGTLQQCLFALVALGVCTYTNSDCILAALRAQMEPKPLTLEQLRERNGKSVVEYGETWVAYDREPRGPGMKKG